MDTATAAAKITKFLRIRNSCLSYAGTKDKRGVTTQWCTVSGVAIENVAKLNSLFRGNPVIRLGNFSLVDSPIELAQLKGNRFGIAIRNVENNPEQLSQACEVFEKSGFINYFGMQRFGTGGVSTHLIGRSILHCNWTEAVRLIMAPRNGEKEQTRRAREQFFISTPEESLKIMPKMMLLERGVLTALVKNGKEHPTHAIQAIPKNTRTMYLHAYQSYIWNHAVSKRIELFGIEHLVPGDIVITGYEKNTEKRGAKEKAVIHFITNEDIEQQKYTIWDLVLPLPGFAISLPKNSIGEYYEQLLGEDGLTLSHLSMRSFPELSIGGDYRHVFIKPRDFMWSIKHYSDDNDILIESDLTILENQPVIDTTNDGPFTALIVLFNLPPSSYATMSIRELTKLSSSPSVQRQLQNLLDTT